MAGIYPNSDVIICKGVPLDVNYEHTIYQDSLASQYAMISLYQKNRGYSNQFYLSAQSYQRLNKGSIRVGLKSDVLYDCNYMMFRNTSYTNTDGTAKWFYAFITAVEYVNDNCSDIFYEIDVMQTWYFDYDLGLCYVEREHSLTDSVNDNYVPEPFDAPDYVVQNTWRKLFQYGQSSPSNYLFYARINYIPNEYFCYANIGSDYHVVMSKTSKGDTPYPGYFDNGIYVAGGWVEIPIFGQYESITAQNISTAIEYIVENSGNIINISLVPAPGVQPDFSITENSYFSDNVGHTYLPKNHKMYHYPFRKLLVTNSQGKQKEYMWEFFYHTDTQGAKNADFGINICREPKGEAYLYPKYYAQGDIENGLEFNGFPIYTWSEDSWDKWWAQNGTGAVISMVSSAITSFITTIAGGGGSVSSYVGTRTTLNTVNDGISFIGNAINKIATPDVANGGFSGDLTSISQDRMGFTIWDLGVRPDVAETIDNYFTKFGYATNKLKELNVRSVAKSTLRPHWNYVKTSSCTCHGNNMNANDERKIEEVYNNGITFWLVASEVGNYSLNNYPRG